MEEQLRCCNVLSGSNKKKRGGGHPFPELLMACMQGALAVVRLAVVGGNGGYPCVKVQGHY